MELTSLTNHLGPFYLTQLLLPKLKKTADEENKEVRIVNVASRLEKSAGPNKTPGTSIRSRVTFLVTLVFIK